MKLRKARIVIQSAASFKEDIKKALKGELKSIQRVDDIFFVNAESLSKIITSARLAILAALVKQKPKSIYELAKMIGRDFKNVHTDVKILADLGLIDLKPSGNRSALKPVALFSGLEFDLAA